jgi:hypothetical protein
MAHSCRVDSIGLMTKTVRNNVCYKCTCEESLATSYRPRIERGHVSKTSPAGAEQYVSALTTY